MAVPDETVPHRPHGSCGCGADLASADDVGIERSHQVHDLPEVHITVWQTSEDVTQDRLDIRSYIDTARKQGVNVMTAIRRAITGKPWRPPGPAPA